MSSVDPYELTQISDALKTVSYRPGDYVIREAEMGDVFYMVENGEAEATKCFEPGKPATVVKKYKSGDYFGELALIKGEPRAASVIARTDLKLVSLDRGAFKRLLGPIEEILKRNADQYTKYIK